MLRHSYKPKTKLPNSTKCVKQSSEKIKQENVRKQLNKTMYVPGIREEDTF